MKLLVIHNRYLNPGGEDVVFESEVELLRQYGHEVVTWEESNESLKEESKIGSAVQAIWSSRSQKRLEEILRQYQPDLAHFHNTFLRISPAAYYTCQNAGIPVVQTLHNYRLLCPAATLFRDGEICEDCLGHWGLWPSVQHKCWHSSRSQSTVVATMLTTHRWLRTWQRQVNLYIALTEFARSKFIAGGIPAEKIVVKPNFIPLLPPALSKSPSTPPFVLFVGRLSSEKGVGILLEAWKSFPSIPLKIVGNGPLRSELEQMARQNGLQNVEFCGARSHEDVLAMMQQATLLVMPSVWYEGLPVTLLEAFACHLPVIATRLGSMAEVIRHGENGLLFGRTDVGDLIKWIMWAWNHPSKLSDLAKNAYQDFQARYSPAYNYECLMNIYRRACTT